ncbi:MAG TPA: DNA polymerase/3'-5' exonuclease PolX [Gemmatimonadaceae bacterium]|nr:DNA polymerase/3'-5' exonuclease PolX [Gemmatimonadaceae bacterium]
MAHVLEQIGDLLELHGENRFKTAAYRNAARAMSALQVDDIRPLVRSGEIATMKGIGPATLSVIEEMAETGDSSYYEQLSEDTPEGLIEMLRVPGLGTSKIHAIHEGLGIDTLHELEEAARDGRLARLPRFGEKTAEKILKGIAYLRETSAFILFPQALAEAKRLLASIGSHPGVERAEIAGSVRRRCAVIRDIDIVAACTDAPEQVAASFAHAPGVREAVGVGGRSVTIRFVDGTLLDLHCVSPDGFAMALWHATGSAAHERAMRDRAESLGLSMNGDRLLDPAGKPVPIPDEEKLYAALGLPFVEPELREGRGEIDAAEADTLPSLITLRDIRGVLHCHSQYSDGKATIAEMAAAARERGWKYLGISDHSQSAFYAGGLSRDAVRQQHAEIDRINDEMDGFRVLKGIEADILADGTVDYDAELLDSFDYVIASVHSRFGMEREAMTDRVLRALDDPHVAILGHPTGRLLLTRDAYAIDLEAVIQKATEVGVAVELNADPHRLDIDWRYCQMARELGCTIEIGPDAHSPAGLDNMEIGIGVARKGWLEASNVLNTGTADDVLLWARSRRES